MKQLVKDFTQSRRGRLIRGDAEYMCNTSDFRELWKKKKIAPLQRLFRFLSFYRLSVKLLRTSEKLTLLIQLGREFL